MCGANHIAPSNGNKVINKEMADVPIPLESWATYLFFVIIKQKLMTGMYYY